MNESKADAVARMARELDDSRKEWERLAAERFGEAARARTDLEQATAALVDVNRERDQLAKALEERTAGLNGALALAEAERLRCNGWQAKAEGLETALKERTAERDARDRLIEAALAEEKRQQDERAAIPAALGLERETSVAAVLQAIEALKEPRPFISAECGVGPVELDADELGADYNEAARRFPVPDGMRSAIMWRDLNDRGRHRLACFAGIAIARFAAKKCDECPHAVIDGTHDARCSKATERDRRRGMDDETEGDRCAEGIAVLRGKLDEEVASLWKSFGAHEKLEAWEAEADMSLRAHGEEITSLNGKVDRLRKAVEIASSFKFELDATYRYVGGDKRITWKTTEPQVGSTWICESLSADGSIAELRLENDPACMLSFRRDGDMFPEVFRLEARGWEREIGKLRELLRGQREAVPDGDLRRISNLERKWVELDAESGKRSGRYTTQEDDSIRCSFCSAQVSSCNGAVTHQPTCPRLRVARPPT